MPWQVTGAWQVFCLCLGLFKSHFFFPGGLRES